MLSPTILQTSNDVMKIYDIVCDVVYNIVYNIVYDVVYDFVYNIVYDIVYDVAYDIIYDVTQFIQLAARLLHQRTLLPSDSASKFLLLYALILEHAPAASLLHP